MSDELARAGESGVARDAQEILMRMGLIGPGRQVRCTALSGGVSSDIIRVDLPEGSICLKRALARLKVAAEWRAPVERSAHEVAWMRVAARAVPGSAPAVLGVDEQSRSFAMPYLDPTSYPLWKAELRAGRVEPGFAATVGARLVGIHAATAGDAEVARTFATDDKFHAIRLEPYLIASARRHPDRAPALDALVRETAATHRALVHGDVSPKNILLGPDGPMFLDAECAWYGDPAFDLAFCLNHLLLKCRWVPEHAGALLASFDALAAAYLKGVNWEPPGALESRAARLLPGLLLARVDGKSPVEYLEDQAARAPVREVARALLAHPSTTSLSPTSLSPTSLSTVREAWAASLDRDGHLARERER
jgi:aminoglycoside phosphotransferase (APT) family kinase protein